MIRTPQLPWRKVAVFLLAAGAVAAATAQEMEVQFTGTLTAVGAVPGANVGDTLAGSLTLDLGALVPATMTNGTTFSAATSSSLDPDPAPGRSSLALSSGTSFATGAAGFNHIAGISLYRNAGTGDNIYSLSSTDLELPPGLESNSITLTVFDKLGSATGIYATPPGDLSLLQAIDWFAAGATAVGNFTLGDGGGAFTITSLHVGPVAAVPEPGTLPLLLAGIGCVGVAVRRRLRGESRLPM